jgi:hypothetical protein
MTEGLLELGGAALAICCFEGTSWPVPLTPLYLWFVNTMIGLETVHVVSLRTPLPLHNPAYTDDQ